MKSILDPTFKYYSSVETDLRRTFQRIREGMSHVDSARGESRRPGALVKSASVGVPRVLRTPRDMAIETPVPTKVGSEA
jgi:hypothetical protein